MAVFLRPGEKRQGAFGVTFDLTAGSSQPAPIFNKNESLALQDQRRRLPAFQHRCVSDTKQRWITASMSRFHGYT